MKHEKYMITGMSCSACSSRVEKAVSKLTGISKASVNLLTNSMQVEYDENILDSRTIIDAVVHAGYGASLDGGKSSIQNEVPTVNASSEIKSMKHRLLCILPCTICF